MSYLIALFIHWFCDFILQDGDIRVDKESKYKIKHCAYYSLTFPICSITLWIMSPVGFANFLYFVLTCVVSHAVVDYILIPWLYKFKSNLQRLGIAWATDQVIHVAIIFSAIYLWL